MTSGRTLPKVSGLVKGDREGLRPLRPINANFDPERFKVQPENDSNADHVVPATTKIAIHLLDDSPSQYRLTYPAADIDSLAQTLIKGQVTPIRVRRKANGRFEIIHGHRRSRAAKVAGLECLDAIVVEVDDKRAAIEVILGNESQESVGDFERATGYKILKEQGLKQVEIADELGLSKQIISNRLKFFEFPPSILNALTKYPRTLTHHSVPQLLAILVESPELESDISDGIEKIAMAGGSAQTLYSTLRQKQANSQKVAGKNKPLLVTDRNSQILLTVSVKRNGRIELQLALGCDTEKFLKGITAYAREQAEGGASTLFVDSL